MAVAVAPPPVPTPVSAAPRVDNAAMPASEATHLRPDQPRPTVPRTGARAMFGLQRLLEPNRFWYRVALWLESSPLLYRAFTRAEKLIKGGLFGCRMCAQCALPTTAYACPMTCPKQLRNGPCGGVSPTGMCEVYPDLRCVWTVAYERAEHEGRVADLRRLQRPIDQRKWHESSWVNHWLGRDEDLWIEDDGLEGSPLINLEVAPRRGVEPAATPLVDRSRERRATRLVDAA